MADNTQEKTTLVLGGTGKTGRRVAERLTAQGLPVRVGSRTGEPPFNWENHDTWSPALHGVEAAYVSYYPDLAAPGAPAAIRSFTDLTAAAGVRRLVLLSGRGEEEAQACEQVVQESGAEWTIVRSSWFCQNFSEDYLLEPVLGGEVALPVGDIPEPFVDAEDIAAVAVAALTQDGHAGQVYEVTGPRALTFDEAITQIAKATGRDIRFVRVSPEEYAAALAEHAVPAEVIALMTYLFTTVLDGRNAHVADGVKRALGHEPKDFTDYARDTAATGVWGR
jgi:uncharacterized protein YbjT (DUF2867 family)